MCDSSCATTACSSSRESRARRPAVTATWARSAVIPVAKALGSSSGTTQIRGRGTPAAMAISSTTFTSRRWASVAGSITSHAPVDQSTRSAPRFHEWRAVPAATAQTTRPIHGTAWR